MQKMIRQLLITILLAFMAVQSYAQGYDNRAKQPDWGPAGYTFAAYYYIPAMDVYYDVDSAEFYVLNGKEWASTPLLPEALQSIDLYRCYKVVMNGDSPWQNHDRHREVYERYRSRRSAQTTIRDERNSAAQHDSRPTRLERRRRGA